MKPSQLAVLRSAFGDHLQENIPLAGFTSARIGGPADFLVTVRSAGELEQAARRLWELDLPFVLLAGGSNVLVSDKGVRGIVVLNRARSVKFNLKAEPPSVLAESGVMLNEITQRAGKHGLSGLEWATGIPGSLGGAVYGNAGAFGSDISANLLQVNLLRREGSLETWTTAQMGYGYRTSVLKREHPAVVILSAELSLKQGDKGPIQEKMEQINTRRKGTQPPGASMGSMFKNPPGNYAGRLIEAAGLKGTRIGNAEISPVHANFFINNGQTRAVDIKALVELARKTVSEKLGITLELEVEMIGEW
jgi:UDP-N-acetylmuramate dehydrogenase